jgi:hypothetical protein
MPRVQHSNNGVFVPKRKTVTPASEEKNGFSSPRKTTATATRPPSNVKIEHRLEKEAARTWASPTPPVFPEFDD